MTRELIYFALDRVPRTLEDCGRSGIRQEFRSSADDSESLDDFRYWVYVRFFIFLLGFGTICEATESRPSRPAAASALARSSRNFARYLEDAYELAEPGTVHVITRYRDTNANLRTTFKKIITRAGCSKTCERPAKRN